MVDGHLGGLSIPRFADTVGQSHSDLGTDGCLQLRGNRAALPQRVGSTTTSMWWCASQMAPPTRRWPAFRPQRTPIPRPRRRSAWSGRRSGARYPIWISIDLSNVVDWQTMQGIPAWWHYLGRLTKQTFHVWWRVLPKILAAWTGGWLVLNMTMVLTAPLQQDYSWLVVVLFSFGLFATARGHRPGRKSCRRLRY